MPPAEILSRGPMPPPAPRSILTATLRSRNALKEVKLLPYPLAIGVALGGLLLDVVVPLPKPRAGFLREPSLLSTRAVPRTMRSMTAHEEYDAAPAASVRLN
jgi:hypothetical protein